MGHTLKRRGLPKGTAKVEYHSTIGHWAAIKIVVEWKSGIKPVGCELSMHKVWAKAEIQALADALSTITKQDYAKWRKECYDTVIANPIETCSDCEGVGVLETTWNGKPQYPAVCSKCKGVGVVKDLFDWSEYLSIDDLQKVITFLRDSSEIGVS